MNLPRMSFTLLAAIVLGIVIAIVAPHQLLVTAYKLSLISAAGVGGYWLDRECFPYARPDTFIPGPGAPFYQLETIIFAACMIRRAIIIAACMIAVGLGA